MSADPSTWGVQPNGWYTPTLQEVLGDLKGNLTQFVDANLDLDDDAPEGQMAGVYAREAALLWEAGQALHDSNDPDNAENAQLQNICKLSGTAMQGPQKTTVACLCGLVSGTVLQNGVAIASLNLKPDVQFTPVSDFTAPSDGTFSVIFECLTTGPVTVAAGELIIISSPITGWTSISNPLPGVTGSVGDSNEVLRLRREADLAATGTSTAPALEADIAALAGVVSVKVLENDTNETDADGVAPHFTESIVYGTVDETELAKVIWEGKPAGHSTQGTHPISFVDSKGITRSVKYSPASAVPIYLVYTLDKTGTGYVGDTQAKADIVDGLQAITKPGKDVIAIRAAAQALTVQGVEDVTAYALGTAPGPTGQANIPITVRQIATFSSANVTL